MEAVGHISLNVYVRTKWMQLGPAPSRYW